MRIGRFPVRTGMGHAGPHYAPIKKTPTLVRAIMKQGLGSQLELIQAMAMGVPFGASPLCRARIATSSAPAPPAPNRDLPPSRPANADAFWPLGWETCLVNKKYISFDGS